MSWHASLPIEACGARSLLQSNGENLRLPWSAGAAAQVTSACFYAISLRPVLAFQSPQRRHRSLPTSREPWHCAARCL